ncbi:hypothetical protein [Paraburkholderia hospita]|uniref:hypothetical protein n=1 Tax=Paraburkholderia hospita TaxID=169430 RepID=UPI003BFA39AA
MGLLAWSGRAISSARRRSQCCVTSNTYEQYLTCFPAYLQQLTIENNGKHLALDATCVGYQTGPIYWGNPAPTASILHGAKVLRRTDNGNPIKQQDVFHYRSRCEIS